MSNQPKIVTSNYIQSHPASIPAQVIPAVIVEPVSDNSDITDDMVICYSYSKTVKCLSMIDIIFSCIYAIYNPYFFVPIIIALTGYYGANKYQTCPILIYFIYNFIGNIARIGYSIYLYSIINNDQRGDYMFSFIFSIFCGFIGLWIARIIYKFYTCIKKLNPEEIYRLKLLQYYNNYRVIVW